MANWLPWRFSNSQLEKLYEADRTLSWLRLDRAVVVPWSLLWLSIIRRHWHALPYLAILKSFCFFIVIISPSYLQLVLGQRRYRRFRQLIVIIAKTAYVCHAGGGLYRDGMMLVGTTALDAANLFVRLMVGSRTLFWLVLAFGYELPPVLQIPVEGVLVGLMMWLKPSEPFCAVMQSAESEPLFRSIASGLPLVSLMPLGRPQLALGADVCNPLIKWMQIGIGFLLPALAHMCMDMVARRRFVARRAAALSQDEANYWVPNKSASAFNPWAIMALVYPHMLTALWYVLMWQHLEFPTQGQVAAAATTAAVGS